MKICSVVFKNNGKSYDFIDEKNSKINDYVIVNTEKGIQYGKVIKTIEVSEDNSSLEYKNIVRIATEEDKSNYLSLLKESSVALNKCKNLVKTLELKMNVLSAEFNFDKTQLVFLFTSDDRVDFRELAKKLASIYHIRIELRQIGARDKAKEVGGIGVCGQKICCARFLHKMDAISMNMAKNQNLALNPNKINGVCGRLLCCLQYEDDNYVRSCKGLPSVGDEYVVSNNVGKVVSVDILNRKIKVLVNGNKEEVTIDEQQ